AGHRLRTVGTAAPQRSLGNLGGTLIALVPHETIQAGIRGKFLAAAAAAEEVFFFITATRLLFLGELADDVAGGVENLQCDLGRLFLLAGRAFVGISLGFG